MALQSNFRFEEEFKIPFLSTHIPREADVVIVGGGLAGLLTLYFVTKNTKLNAFLIEEGSLGFHSSGRGIGSINLFSENVIRHITEHDDGHTILPLVKAEADKLSSLIKNESLDCDYQKIGGIYVGEYDTGLANLRKIHELCEKHYPDTFWTQSISNTNLKELVQSESRVLNGGIFCPPDFNFSPVKLINSLSRLLERDQRRILSNCILDNVTQTQSGINVHIRNRGVISTKTIVYCTGIYSQKVVPGVSKFLMANKQHIIATQKLPTPSLLGIPSNPIVINGTRVRLVNNRFLLESSPLLSSEKIYDGEINIRACENLRKLFRLLYPDIAKCEIEYLWSHISCCGIDGFPISGQLFNRPNEYINIGFGSSNLNFIVSASEMISNMIANGTVSEQYQKLFNPRRANNV